jgi:hypothetical protein
MISFETPILKLRGIADVVYAAGNVDIEIHTLAGIGEVLNDIADEFRELEGKVHHELTVAKEKAKTA